MGVFFFLVPRRAESLCKGLVCALIECEGGNREGSLFSLFSPCWGRKSAQKMPGFSSPVTHIITHFFLVPLWEAEIQHKQNPGIASRVFAV